MDYLTDKNIDIHRINKALEAKNIQRLIDCDDEYLLGKASPATGSETKTNWNYQQWKSKGFRHKKALLLSSLNFHTFTPNIVLLKILDYKNNKTLDTLVHATNKQLNTKNINIEIIPRQNLGRKLK